MEVIFTVNYNVYNYNCNYNMHKLLNKPYIHTITSGRYNKLSRELSQTPWFINGEKKMQTSVQDILCNPIADVTKAQCKSNIL